jgi:2-polyprenyl-6-methoxyphenol hydroxylase-like FAD-dependent oxidoreductase
MARVAICGAGPGGAALAYLLARRGVDVTLIERQRDFAREFRGEAIMPSGRDAFRQMGLGGDFDALSHSEPRRVRLHRNGRFAVEFSAEGLGIDDVLPRIVSQPEMLEMLVARASQFPNFRFLRGASVSDLVDERGRAAGVRLRGGSEETIGADLVVGADGRGSIVRRRAGLTDEHDAERFDVVWFKVPLPDFLEDKDHTALVHLGGRGHLMLSFPSYDGRLQVAWIIEKGTFGELRGEGIEHWVEQMAAHAGPELGEHLRRSLSDLGHPFVLDVVCYLLPAWTSPGVMLLGDAAHPMSPVGGQGINIALRDALVAANHLVPVLTEGSGALASSIARLAAIDVATQAFQQERYPEVETLQAMQRVPPRFVFQRAWWARAALAAAPLLFRLMRFAPRGGPVLERFAFGVTDVELRV